MLNENLKIDIKVKNDGFERHKIHDITLAILYC